MLYSIYNLIKLFACCRLDGWNQVGNEKSYEPTDNTLQLHGGVSSNKAHASTVSKTAPTSIQSNKVIKDKFQDGGGLSSLLASLTIEPLESPRSKSQLSICSSSNGNHTNRSDDEVTIDYNNEIDDETIEYSDDESDFDFDQKYAQIAGVYSCLDQVSDNLGNFVIEINVCIDNDACDVSEFEDRLSVFIDAEQEVQIQHQRQEVSSQRQDDSEDERQLNLAIISNSRDEEHSISSNKGTREDSSQMSACDTSSDDASDYDSFDENSSNDSNIDDLSVLSEDVRPYGETGKTKYDKLLYNL